MRCNIIDPRLGLYPATVQRITRGGGLRLDSHVSGNTAVNMTMIANRVFGLVEPPFVSDENMQHLRNGILGSKERIAAIGSVLRDSFPEAASKGHGLSHFAHIGEHCLALAERKPITPGQQAAIKDAIAAIYTIKVSKGAGDEYVFDGNNDSNLKEVKELIRALNAMRKSIRSMDKDTAKYVKEIAISLGIADWKGQNIPQA